MIPTHILKRDGTLRPFDASRIVRAIALALFEADHGFASTLRDAPDRLYGLAPGRFEVASSFADRVVAGLESSKPSVEEVQDQVEVVLLASGEISAARRFIAYRARQAALRPVSHSANGLQDYIGESRYCRFSEDLGRREDWSEAVDRVLGMHERKLGALRLASVAEVVQGLIASGKISDSAVRDAGGFDGIVDEVRSAFELVKAKKVLPSMRSMQFGGRAIEVANSRMFNCAFSPANRVEFFREFFYLLLCGCGVGFSVQKQHIGALPAIAHRSDELELEVKHIAVADTIEGWADSLHELLASYIEGHKVEFAFNQIRRRGSLLRTSGGKAPGHLPLKRALVAVESILAGAAGRVLRPIEVYDICMHVAQSVLSGGIRRSATICLFSADDEEMMAAKTGNWFESSPHRSASNNSAVLVRGSVTREQFDRLFECQKQFGEPGFYFAENAELGCNPCCVSGESWVMTDEGPRRARCLAGQPFRASVNGEQFATSGRGMFATGKKEVFTVQTFEGYDLTATADHRILVARGVSHPRVPGLRGKRRRSLRTEWLTIEELKAGDNVVLHRHNDLTWSGIGDADQGWLAGLLLGDGNIDAECANLDFWGPTRQWMVDRVCAALMKSIGHRKGVPLTGCDQSRHDRSRVRSHYLKEFVDQNSLFGANKVVSENLEMASSDFCRGFIRGWMDADGSVSGNHKKGVSLRLTSVSHANLKVAQRILLRLGIVSTIYRNRNGDRTVSRLPDGKGGRREYPTQDYHDLVISGECIDTYVRRIGFAEPDKAARLHRALAGYRRRLNQTDFTARVELVVPRGKMEVFDCTVPGPHAFDAQGFYVHNCEITLNPHLTVTDAEIDKLKAYGYDRPVKVGEVLTGFQMCNLSTLAGSSAKTAEDFFALAKAAAVIGTIQATYTDIPYLGAVTRVLNEREALIGVSICGVLDNPDVLLNAGILTRGAEVVKATNAVMAALLGINRAARTTCVKPEGTSSLVLNSGSGIAPHHARRYFRRVQASTADPVFKWFAANNPHMIEQSVYNAGTAVITFPVEGPKNGVYRNELSAIRHLEMIRLVQEHWVQSGRAVTAYTDGHHNVSNTVNVADGEWHDVAEFVWENRHTFTGVALLPQTGDKAYKQAPREEVVSEDDVRKWNALAYNPVDYRRIPEKEDATAGSEHRGAAVACAGGACSLV